METLFVNACLRGEQSRTLALCERYLEGVPNVREVNLAQVRPEPLYADQVAYRASLQEAGDFDDPIFDLAKEFAAADEIVIGAPYWDLSFPAALKVYIERVSVMDITFHYTEQGLCEGLCNARRLTYITSCGGSVEPLNLGYDYFCGIARMFGIDQVGFAAAEMLDVVGIDIEAQMRIAFDQVDRLRAARDA